VPGWQDIAALTTVGLAALWLLARWLEIGKPRANQAGCARCDHNVMPREAPSSEIGGGIRSARLRVID
jgi:hypothetical protein